MSSYIKITNGPSKFDVMSSLFGTGSDNNIDLGPVFELEDGTKVKVAINQVQREDGSGESWNIIGYQVGSQHQSLDRYVKIYYSTRSRTGTIA